MPVYRRSPMASSLDRQPQSWLTDVKPKSNFDIPQDNLDNLNDKKYQVKSNSCYCLLQMDVGLAMYN